VTVEMRVGRSYLAYGAAAREMFGEFAAVNF